MTNCDAILEAQIAKLPKSFDSLPAHSRVGLLSFQIAAKAMKKAFKEDQSIASVDRLFDLFLKNQSTSEPLMQCAISTIHSLGVNQESIRLIQEQLTAQLSRKGFNTTDQFNTFVDTVFGAFGEMTARLFGADSNPSMTESLREIAKAIGVTRTLREIHVDAENGFNMLSKEHLAEYQVDLEALKSSKINEGFAQLINSLIEPLRRSYANFYSQIDQFPREAKLSLYTFVKTQEAILDEIIWNRYDCLHTELTVSDLRQTIIRFRAKRALKQRGTR